LKENRPGDYTEILDYYELPGSYVRTRRPFRLLRPLPVYILAVYDYARGAPNFTTVSWVIPLENNKPKILIILEKSSYSYGAVLKSRVFSLNLVPCSMLSEAKYFGTRSGRFVDKGTVTGVKYSYYSRMPPVPVLSDSPAFLILKLLNLHEYDEASIFVALLVDALVKTEDYDALHDSVKHETSRCLHLYKNLFLDSRASILSSDMTPWGVAAKDYAFRKFLFK
jgi:flavin reductase (DIM6/NTAB) family NADH-FMN oxidoreductase RutF